jgi:SPX domain protein involved in polyphosphate accumulation
MKFGQQLSASIYKPWQGKYIDYAKLKKLLREDEAETIPWTEEDEEKFVTELTTVELEKVHKHQADTAKDLEKQLKACEEKLQPIAVQDGPPAGVGKAIAEATIKELDKISDEITELKRYSRINYTGFLKAAKKHDRKRGTRFRARPLLQVRLSQLPFNSEDYSPLLYRLSTLYSFARETIEGRDADRQASMAGDRPKDTYTAHKFWVHQDNILEMKTYILRRLPVLVYNPQSLKIVDSSQKDPTTTSLYFDTETFDLYSQRVDKVGDASSLRLRWSGPLNEKPEIMLEKKIVSEASGSSREIRVALKEKHISAFLKGEYKLEKQVKKMEERYGVDSDQAKNLRDNIGTIQSFIKEKRLEPMLRASYTRTAFQIPGDDKIRISLDTDVAFIREDSLDTDRPCRDPEDWHRTDIDDNEMEYPFTSIKKGEISRFEHAILEIKVKDTKATRNNTWLADLMSSHLVKEAPKFSKFIHGVAELFEDQVNSFPFWLSDLETDIRRDPQTAFQEEQEKQAKRAEDEFAVGSFLLESKMSHSPRRASPSMRNLSVSAKNAPLSQSVVSKKSQLATTVEEQDLDDDGMQGQQGESQGNGGAKGLAAFFPSFSNSRYAQRHRNRGWEDAPLPPGVKDPGNWIKDQGPLRVEAKVWLANQRTFVKWQHITVLLATLSLGLYNAAGVDNNIARSLSLVYTAFAVFAGAWGWSMYIWRSKLITQRSGKDFDNMIGPFIVAVGLTMVSLFCLCRRCHETLLSAICSILIFSPYLKALTDRV